MNQDKRELLDLIGVALEEWFGPAHAALAQKWEGGKVTLHSGKSTLQPKEIDLETFFHKVVMVRESLRVLEQKINTHPKLDDADRVALHPYITRCYGSLTTFNVLFADENDKFVGQKT